MPPTTPAPDASSGLISSVFSFVSREVKSFVNSATGINAEEELSEEEELEDEDEEDSETIVPRPKDGGSREEGRRVSLDSPDERRSTLRKAGGRMEPPSQVIGHRQRRRRSDSEELSSPPTRQRPLGKAQANFPEDELSGPEDASASSPRLPPGHILRRRASVTMPGSLYERSSSLEPSPEADLERPRVVRFAPGVGNPPVSNRSAVIAEKEGFLAGPSCPRSKQPPPSNRSYDPRRSKDFVHRNQNTKVSDAARCFSSDDPSDVSLMLPRSPDRHTTKAAGTGSYNRKEKERDSLPEDRDDRQSVENGRLSAQTSYETRVRGKERELRDVIEREKSKDDEVERRRDKERIKILEKEVKKLREELAKRTIVSLIPPPPPPPPPPIPIGAPSIRPPSSQTQPDGPFASARASLRPTAPPTENPINPAYAVPSVKRKGQPTINIGADKMADFLKELKTHRLRKVGDSGPMDLSLDSSIQPYKVQRPPPAMRVRAAGEVGNKSEVVPSKVSEAPFDLPASRGGFSNVTRTAREPNSNSKRKRSIEVTEDDSSISSNKIRVLDLPSTGSNKSTTTRALDSRHITEAPSLKNSRIPILTTRSNSSIISSTDSSYSKWSTGISKSGTELTTPSLCSDTEQGDEPSLEDRVPTTPPLSHSCGRNRSISVDAPHLQQQGNIKIHQRTESILSDENVDRLQRDSNDVTAKQRTRSESASKPQSTSGCLRPPEDMFASRPPSSPLPLDSPKKPRPPARTKSKPVRQVVQDLTDEDDDPLALCFPPVSKESSVRDGIVSSNKRTVKQKERPQIIQISQVACSARSLTQPEESRSAVRGRDTSHRRDTLEAELLRIDSSYSSYDQEFIDDVYDDASQIESGTLIAVGTRPGKDGFIAHGGAGGMPILMGPGDVIDLRSEEPEEPPKRPTRGKRRTSSAALAAGGKKGRSRF